MSSPREIDLSAACLCGAAKVTAKGRIASMFLCACLDCQKASGSGHTAALLFPAAGLTVSGPRKSFARPADSGAVFTRHFCPQCATTLFGQSSRAPDFRLLAAGLFAGQNEWYAPSQLIFARSRQEWDMLADHLPRYTTYRAPVSPPPSP